MVFESATARLALDLAAFFQAPSTRIDPERHLSAEELALLPATGRAARLREELLRARCGLTDVAFAPDFAIRCATSEDLRTAARLTLMVPAALQRLLQHLTAAICRDRLRNAVLKRERQALLDVFGPEAAEAGLRHATLFAPGLTALDAPQVPPEGLMARSAGCLCAWIAAQEPLLAQIFRLRQPCDPVDLTPAEAESLKAYLKGRI